MILVNPIRTGEEWNSNFMSNNILGQAKTFVLKCTLYIYKKFVYILQIYNNK